MLMTYPYDETIVMDVDMFCPVDLNEYFDLLSDEDLWFTTKFIHILISSIQCLL